MNTVQNLKKQKAYAWAKYYEQVNNAHHNDGAMYQTIIRTSDEMPTHIKEEFKQMAAALKKKWECPVCYDFIPDETLEITNCGHFYCKDCLNGWKQTQKQQGKEKWSCCVCVREHSH